jgi:AbiV family abortive infection protein
MNAASHNAQRLTADAELLFREKRFATAFSLAALSIEESGKVSILRELSMVRGADAVRAVWKRYRTHTEKNQMWVLLDMYQEGARKLGDFHPMFSLDNDHPEVLDSLKQLGFYTDCVGNARWSCPDRTITESLARSVLDVAAILARGSDVTEREIQLWQECLGPVWGQGKEQMEEGLIRWYDRMQDAGLKPPGENVMKMFVMHGIGASPTPDGLGRTES